MFLCPVLPAAEFNYKVISIHIIFNIIVEDMTSFIPEFSQK